MNNGVNNSNNNVNSSGANNNTGVAREEIKAAKVYKLAPENKPQELPKTIDIKAELEKKKEKPVEKEQPAVQPTLVVKKKNILARILFLIVIVLIGYIGYSYYTNSIKINRYKTFFSPVSTTGEEKKLDIESTFVLDLYNKVKTNIREDIAEATLNDSMKLYLAYRNIPHDRFYESDCSSFDNAAMIPYTCNSNTPGFAPKAFKKESLLIEYEKLFGDTTNLVLGNIQIGRNCIGGYQYIQSRGEYVQGMCTNNITTTYKANKKLVSAVSKESVITIKEDVKYISSEGQTLPEYLKSGTYVYVFKLDKNYNYIYVSKYLEKE